jgi:hypothetical protein
MQTMNALAKVLIFKIAATLLFWCIPLILFPASLLQALGLPVDPTAMFLRMLGWAYLALCVGYGFALAAALRGERLLGPIWVGLVSNGGACLYLSYYGLNGAWNAWSGAVQFVLWASVAATLAITSGLYRYGLRPPHE